MDKIFYASDYVTLDSNVYTGGGTDVTEAFQGLLDKAITLGMMHIVMDGAALVRGLQIHSNTTIECLNSDCGFYLADNSDCPVLRNSNRSFSKIKTRNITLQGGTYNQNCLNQAHDVATDKSILPEDAMYDAKTADCESNSVGKEFVVALMFIGVENLVVRDVIIRDQRTYAFAGGNFRKMYIENVFVELDNPMILNNQDGFHFWGPGEFLTMKNVGGSCEDDFMNIGPDERDSVSSITDVLIDGVYLDNARQGIRLISREKGTLDRVTIRNVSGTYSSFGFYISPWFVNDIMGCFGTVTFENINLRPTYNSLEGKCDVEPFLFCIGGNFRSLNFKNIFWNEPCDNRMMFYVGYPFYSVSMPLKHYMPKIENLLIEGLQINDSKNCYDGCNLMELRGIIKNMIIRNAEIFGSESAENGLTLVKLTKESEIGRLAYESVYTIDIARLTDTSEKKPCRLVEYNVDNA